MARSKLRILCLGDSLTAGYSSLGAVYKPYSEQMVKLLRAALPDVEIEAVEDGVPGQTTAGFLGRLDPHFGPGKPSYDWTILLGGTNDLGYNHTAEAIFANLAKCWDVAQAHGSKVLVLTVPEVGVRGGPAMQRIHAQRDELNRLIRNAQGGNIFVHDHHAAVPFWAMSEKDRQLYWDDNVHLTPSGYDLMGQKIAARFLQVLHQDGNPSGGPQTAKAEDEEQTAATTAAATSSSRRTRSKVFKDDNLVFEEESGDSSRLGQGYVVVRKKDLE
ncbi:hypothetical protein MAPG_08246 [Magnaporthiopsis poae ATCC 64411]|uniref:SGNH hydrolase-type esterase domain-containing protein n=1 Tax=Magnaporthiopsis poae (strain ATCC 64411 / 73-15) TaxID=644358 RepID=A0A0C4E6U9_MAGP6|nr:hypothetical protein MAPG_08246 [Magnaporthiopsis poae ATCC 64411]